MRVSCLISIHNRSKLFAAGLATMAQQDFPAADWEIVLIDDGSTEDLRKVYEPYIGRLNIRHVRMDHTYHQTFKDLNPDWDGNGTPQWWHTPALSINVGLRMARGEVIWITQPEVLQEKTNLPHGYKAAMNNEFAFVDTHDDRKGEFRDRYLAGEWPGASIHDLVFEHWRDKLDYHKPAMWWFSAFVKRVHAMEVCGVRELYLRGAAAEDDDFRDRLELGGVKPTQVYDAIALHLFHLDEKEFHHRRDHDHWEKGLAHNRGFYERWRNDPKRQARAMEQLTTWGDMRVVTDVTEYPILKA